MALIGISILLASLSLIFCRAQASSFFSRLLHRSRPTIEIHLLEDPTTPQNTSDQKAKPLSERSAEEPAALSNGHLIANSSPTAMANNEPASAAPNTNPPTAADLMPPPPRPDPRPPARSAPTPTSTSSISTPSASSSLRIPTTGPLPNRQPQPSSTLSAASTSTLAPSARPRQKVILEPGHSPLDWAHKTRATPTVELAGVPFPQRITPSQLAWATGRKGKPAWSAYKGRVYNITPYLKFHPGGEAELMRAAGRDGQRLFDEVHAWVNWENMLGACLVGFLVSEADGASK